MGNEKKTEKIEKKKMWANDTHPKDTPQIPTNCTHEQEPHQIYLYKHRGIKDLLCTSSVQLGNSGATGGRNLLNIVSWAIDVMGYT